MTFYEKMEKGGRQLRILISNENNFAHKFIRQSIGRVLTVMGHQVIIWNPNLKPVYDAFDEMGQVDLFIGQTYNIDDCLIECLRERPYCRVTMKGSDFGDVSDNIDREKYPVLIANEKEIDYVKKLKEATGQPELIYVHYDKDAIKKTHNHWEELGFQTHSLMNAADIIQYTNGVFKSEYECDIGFIGGRWGYKSKTLDKWLIPLLSRNHNYRVKIFGNQPWGVSQYCGFIQDDEVKHLFASSKVCPNLSEPHSQDLGYDVIERPFKLLANKCCVLSDYVEDMEKIFPNGEVHFAKTPDEFHSKLDVLLSNPKMRVASGMAGYDTVMKGHTYFHRVRDLMLALNKEEEAINCMNQFEHVKERLNL